MTMSLVYEMVNFQYQFTKLANFCRLIQSLTNDFVKLLKLPGNFIKNVKSYSTVVIVQMIVFCWYLSRKIQAFV